MTPLQLAKVECANWDGGKCLLSKNKGCRLSQEHRCGYFEEYIMPIVKYITDPKRKKEISEAILVYRTDNHMVKVKGKRLATRGSTKMPTEHHHVCQNELETVKNNQGR